MTVCVSSVTCYRFGKCGHVGKKEYTSGAATIRAQHTATRHAEGLNTKMMQRKLLKDKKERMKARNNVALKCGDVEVYLQDSQGRCAVDALFISTYPQAVFSLTAATADDAKVMFKKRGKMSSVPKSEVYFTSRNMRECII